MPPFHPARNHPPVEVIFSPDWWFRHYQIAFDEPFYLDMETRIANDLLMRRIMSTRFGLGEGASAPRPVIGSMFVAGGFVLPALFGVKVRFAKNAAPQPETANLTREEVLALRVPDWQESHPLNILIGDMEKLRERFGSVIGDFDTDGLLNTALHLRGQQLFTDMVEDPDLVNHLFEVLVETYIQIVTFWKEATGSCAIATNRSILNVNPILYLHSNCSVSMISPRLYASVLLPHEKRLADALTPYGIHHCGGNLERYVAVYQGLPVSFLDVGWGSNAAACRAAFPQAFLNLRLNPVRMSTCSPEEIRQDVMALAEQAGNLSQVGFCCINMDASTPDDNVHEFMRAVASLTIG